MGLFGAAHRWGVGGEERGQKGPCYNDETWHSYILPKEDPKKYINRVTHPLSSDDIKAWEKTCLKRPQKSSVSKSLSHTSQPHVQVVPTASANRVWPQCKHLLPCINMKVVTWWWIVISWKKDASKEHIHDVKAGEMVSQQK